MALHAIPVPPSFVVISDDRREADLIAVALKDGMHNGMRGNNDADAVNGATALFFATRIYRHNEGELHAAGRTQVTPTAKSLRVIISDRNSAGARVTLTSSDGTTADAINAPHRFPPFEPTSRDTWEMILPLRDSEASDRFFSLMWLLGFGYYI